MLFKRHPCSRIVQEDLQALGVHGPNRILLLFLCSIDVLLHGIFGPFLRSGLFFSPARLSIPLLMLLPGSPGELHGWRSLSPVRAPHTAWVMRPTQERTAISQMAPPLRIACFCLLTRETGCRPLSKVYDMNNGRHLESFWSFIGITYTWKIIFKIEYRKIESTGRKKLNILTSRNILSRILVSLLCMFLIFLETWHLLYIFMMEFHII